MPRLPPAPLLFSMTNCWPRRADSRSEKMRAAASTLPPAANGTITVTGRVGHCWAAPGATDATIAAAATNAAAVYCLLIVSLPIFLVRQFRTGLLDRLGPARKLLLI